MSAKKVIICCFIAGVITEVLREVAARQLHYQGHANGSFSFFFPPCKWTLALVVGQKYRFGCLSTAFELIKTPPADIRNYERSVLVNKTTHRLRSSCFRRGNGGRALSFVFVLNPSEPYPPVQPRQRHVTFKRSSVPQTFPLIFT